MINHFATLLSNLNLDYSSSVKDYYAIDIGNILPVRSSRMETIITDAYELVHTKSKAYSVLIDRNYVQLNLPTELQQFYNVLFPEGSSNYYKIFLLYSYLRLLDSTDRGTEIKNYDSRISYDLSDIKDYFRFNKTTNFVPTNTEYQLLLSGKYANDITANSYRNTFTVYQVNDSREVLVYSNTQNMYYKQGAKMSKNPAGMSSTLSATQSDGRVSKEIYIGGTGLFFSITGPLDYFMSTADKRWSFSVEAPFVFDFNEKLKELNISSRVVDNMLTYKRDSCNLTYERLWQMHHNDVYKMVGLILAYVERVNLVWANTQM
jgi:hypothetical protein